MNYIHNHLLRWATIGLLVATSGSLTALATPEGELGKEIAREGSLEASKPSLHVVGGTTTTRIITFGNGWTITVTTTVTECKEGKEGCFYNPETKSYEPDRLIN